MSQQTDCKINVSFAKWSLITVQFSILSHALRMMKTSFRCLYVFIYNFMFENILCFKLTVTICRSGVLLIIRTLLSEVFFREKSSGLIRNQQHYIVKCPDHLKMRNILQMLKTRFQKSYTLFQM